ncbi:MAG TPA: oxidoreductase [Spirochaetota bacterium]|nr:oxidoreductase [Spirochaetota bacterium]
MAKDAQTQLVVLVTGASAGIGRETVRLLLEAGHAVWASARNPKKVADLVSVGARAVALDVENESSVKKAPATILKRDGRIDVLINNAGYGSYGTVEDVPLDEARRQFEVNVFGLARLTQLVLPGMRERGSGRIVNIASIAGHVSVPGGAWYHASKHALVAITDALRMETRPFGIRVVMVKPGLVKTDWSRIALESMERYSGRGAYARLVSAMKDFFGKGGTSVHKVARVVVRAALVRRPPVSWAVPFEAKAILFFRRIFPDRMVDAVMQHRLKFRKEKK